MFWAPIIFSKMKPSIVFKNFLSFDKYAKVLFDCFDKRFSSYCFAFCRLILPILASKPTIWSGDISCLCNLEVGIVLWDQLLSVARPHFKPHFKFWFCIMVFYSRHIPASTFRCKRVHHIISV